MKTYNGSLGKFQYDETMWQIGETEDKSEYLKYIGKEKDGLKIAIPEGVIDLSHTFEGSDIISQPTVPDGVVKMDYTFYNCKDLVKAGSLPYGLETINSCWAECKKLEATPYFPDTIKEAEFAFDGAENLRTISGYFPESLEKATGMLSNCRKLESIPYLPDKLKSADSICLNCEALTDMPLLSEGCKDYSYSFAGCKNLQSFTDVPETAKHEGIFDNCDFSEDYIKSHTDHELDSYKTEEYDESASKPSFQTKSFVESRGQIYRAENNKQRGSEFDIQKSDDASVSFEIK